MLSSFTATDELKCDPLPLFANLWAVTTPIPTNEQLICTCILNFTMNVFIKLLKLQEFNFVSIRHLKEN